MILNLNEYVNMDVSLNVNLNVNVRGKRECERKVSVNLTNRTRGPTVSTGEEALSQHFDANELKRT